MQRNTRSKKGPGTAPEQTHVEVPGRPDVDDDTKRKPAYGPGGANPESDTEGTEASEHPGTMQTPYPDDDSNQSQRPPM